MDSELRTRLISFALLLQEDSAVPREHRACLWQNIRALVLQSGSPDQASLLTQVGLARQQILSWQRTESSSNFRRRLRLITAWLEADRQCLLLGDELYPSRLLELADPPLTLWCEGKATCLSLPQIAIVGSRKATRGGRLLAERLAADLGAAGFCITSGLALGIDGAAHAACLDRGHRTLAVLGCGPDQNYPRSHRLLQQRLARSGCVVSEYPPGTAPLAYHFPQRNRLISALSLAVLVVEAGRKSGSLITARSALELGREVFAVPGSPLSQVSHGCHQLLRDGAQLVEAAEDVLNGLPGWAWSQSQRGEEASGSQPPPELTHLELVILEQMETLPLPLDKLLRLVDAPVQKISQALVELELKQLIAREGGGLVRLHR